MDAIIQVALNANNKSELIELTLKDLGIIPKSFKNMTVSNEASIKKATVIKTLPIITDEYH